MWKQAIGTQTSHNISFCCSRELRECWETLQLPNSLSHPIFLKAFLHIWTSVILEISPFGRHAWWPSLPSFGSQIFLFTHWQSSNPLNISLENPYPSILKDYPISTTYPTHSPPSHSRVLPMSGTGFTSVHEDGPSSTTSLPFICIHHPTRGDSIHICRLPFTPQVMSAARRYSSYSIFRP